MRTDRRVRRLASRSGLPLAVAGTVLLFLFAVQLLGASTEAAAPWLRRGLLTLLENDGSALGLGWIGAYVLANGSVVATMSLSLFNAELLSVPNLFFMVVGSRLGAAGIIVVIGAVDYVQRGPLTLAESIRMGLLTFLLTLSIYLPVAALGPVALPLLPGSQGVEVTMAVALGPFDLFGPVTRAFTTALGAGPSLLLAVAGLFASLKLFDEVLSRVETRTLRRRLFDNFERTWFSFGLGLVVTGLTTSVTFSLGVLVPLYNRRYVERDELIPFVLGANIGTFFDTLVVAIVLGSPDGIAVVLLIVGLAVVLTLIALGLGGRYRRSIGVLDDRLLTDRAAFVGFGVLLVLVPLGLLLVPMIG